jgi:hypothetical protein
MKCFKTLKDAIIHFAEFEKLQSCNDADAMAQWRCAVPDLRRNKASVACQEQGLEVLQRSSPPQVLAQERDDLRGVSVSS